MILQSCGESSSTMICSCKQALLGMCRQSYFSERIHRFSHSIKAGLSLGGFISMATTASCRLQMPIPTHQTRVWSKVSRCLLRYCRFPWLSFPFAIYLHNVFPGILESFWSFEVDRSVWHTQLFKELMNLRYGWWLLTTQLFFFGELFRDRVHFVNVVRYYRNSLRFPCLHWDNA